MIARFSYVSMLAGLKDGHSSSNASHMTTTK